MSATHSAARAHECTFTGLRDVDCNPLCTTCGSPLTVAVCSECGCEITRSTDGVWRISAYRGELCSATESSHVPEEGKS